MMTAHLGFIPDWQYNPNPALNPLLNPHVVGQPNPIYQQGLGFTMVDWNPLQGALRGGRLGADTESHAKGAGMGLLIGLGLMAFLALSVIKK